MGAEVKRKITIEEFEALTAHMTILDLIERHVKAVHIIESLVGASQLAELQDIEKALATIQKPRDQIKNTLAAIHFLIEEY